MKSNFQGFLQLTEDEKKNLLNSNGFNLSKYLKKGFSYLSNQELETIFNLKKLDEQAINFVEQFSLEIPKLLPQILALAQAGLIGNLEAVKEPVLELFSSTIIISFNIITKNMNDGLRNGDSLLLGGTLASSAATILETVLNFEKKLDALYPGLSNKIIEGIGNSITLVLATQCPVAAVIFKASGITEFTKNFLNCENLEKTIELLRSKIAEVKADPKLALLQENAEAISKAAADTGLSVNTLQRAELDKEALAKTTKIPQNDNYKKLTQELNQQATKIPLSKQMIDGQMNNVKVIIEKIIDASGLNSAQTDNIKKILINKIDEASKILAGSLDKAQSLMQKIQIGNIAAEKITDFLPKNIDPTIKKFIGTELGKIIDQQLPRLSTSLVECIKKSLQLAKILGLTKAMELALKKITPQTEKSRVR